jgi:hypothetical protein
MIKRFETFRQHPLSEDEFYDMYVAIHNDIRTRGESKPEILKYGFHEGTNVNAMPFSRYYDSDTSYNPYKPKTGHFIWLLPKEGVTLGRNGYKTVEGYIPDEEEGFYITDDNLSIYQNYLQQF